MAWTLLFALAGLIALGPGSALAADGGKIVYIPRANAAGQGKVLVAREPDGRGRTVLRRAAGPGDCVGNPASSPDGASLALESCDALATMRADGSGFVELPRFSQPEQTGAFFYARDVEPAWSPGGARLAFVSVTGYDDGFVPYQSRRLVVANADGSNPRTVGGEQAVDPDWSSRGLIAFSDEPNRGDPSIWVIRPDGSDLRRLIRRADQPAWSPDGRRIAFVRGPGGGVPFRTVGTRIHLAGADGKHVRTVARGFYPTWSPNGRRLAFVQPRLTPSDTLTWAIYTIRRDGSDRRLVARSRRELGALTWQPAPAAAAAADAWRKTPPGPLSARRRRLARVPSRPRSRSPSASRRGRPTG